MTIDKSGFKQDDLPFPLSQLDKFIEFFCNSTITVFAPSSTGGELTVYDQDAVISINVDHDIILELQLKRNKVNWPYDTIVVDVLKITRVSMFRMKSFALHMAQVVKGFGYDHLCFYVNDPRLKTVLIEAGFERNSDLAYILNIHKSEELRNWVMH